MNQPKNIHPPDVIILIAAQFDEREVISCLSEMRDQQLSVVLISVIPGLVRSFRGITVHPDSHLSLGGGLISQTKRQMVILAGGESCAAKTLSDPRTHQLIGSVLQRGGYMGVMAKADFLVKEMGLFTMEWANQIIYQGEKNTAVFGQHLKDRMNAD